MPTVSLCMYIYVLEQESSSSLYLKPALCYSCKVGNILAENIMSKECDMQTVFFFSCLELQIFLLVFALWALVKLQDL